MRTWGQNRTSVQLPIQCNPANTPVLGAWETGEGGEVPALMTSLKSL